MVTLGKHGEYYLLSGVPDVYRFLGALKCILKADWGIYVEGVEDKETSDLLESVNSRELSVTICRDFVYPKRNVFVVEASEKTVEQLQILAKKVFSVDFIQSLVVFDDSRVLIEAYGLGCGDVVLSKFLGESSIEKLQAECGGMIARYDTKE